MTLRQGVTSMIILLRMLILATHLLILLQARRQIVSLTLFLICLSKTVKPTANISQLSMVRLMPTTCSSIYEELAAISDLSGHLAQFLQQDSSSCLEELQRLRSMTRKDSE